MENYCDNMAPELSIIVPCYNEEESIPIFYDEVTKVVRTIGCSYEILFINDGSSDRSLNEMKELSEKDPNVNYYSFSRNFGKESAMYAGLCNASGDYVAIMDVDLQDPPSLLPEMLEILKTDEYDNVATRRSDRKGESIIKSFLSNSFYKVINRISDVKIESGARDFRLMKRNMVDAIVQMGENNRFSKGLFAWVGFRTYWLSFENVERVAGETKWSTWKLFKYSIEGIINYSHAPLAIASTMGFLFTFLSIIGIAIIIIRQLFFGGSVEGWSSLVCVIMFLGGIQLLCMGIMGQYISKTYIETKNRPHYIISETNKDDTKKIN